MLTIIKIFYKSILFFTTAQVVKKGIFETELKLHHLDQSGWNISIPIIGKLRSLPTNHPLILEIFNDFKLQSSQQFFREQMRIAK